VTLLVDLEVYLQPRRSLSSKVFAENKPKKHKHKKTESVTDSQEAPEVQIPLLPFFDFPIINNNLIILVFIKRFLLTFTYAGKDKKPGYPDREQLQRSKQVWAHQHCETAWP
jgi:hypothetical protein